MAASAVNIISRSPGGVGPFDSRLQHGQDSTMVSQSYICSPSPVSVKKHWKKKDPVSIERSNLVNITKLVVKELIESSLRYGRQLDSDSVSLQHFFIVLEHVLRHGLKPKRGILGPKKELWDLFQNVEKWSYEAQDITSSVRDLPTVKTHIGRARAWLRLSLMQKKLADYFRMMLERRDEFLTEFYEEGSLMLSDEAVIIMGLLVGLNVIDCNFCVKEEDLDSQMGVIDFSLYLRTFGVETKPDESVEQANMTTVLDQKNYVEELNRHLTATVANLQAKVEALTTTNALMKEDLSITKNTLLHVQNENSQLRKECGLSPEQKTKHSEHEPKATPHSAISSGYEEEIQNLKQQLAEEATQQKQLEKELKLQIQMKAECEMATKLLEKDIHEKQDTIISLRRQLDDIKSINFEMYEKLQECEASLKSKANVIKEMQSRNEELEASRKKLESQYDECVTQKEAAKQTAKHLSVKLSEMELFTSSLEHDIKVEKETRESLQDSVLKDKEAKAQMQQEISTLRAVEMEYSSLRRAHTQLIATVEDQEKTLEELGTHLSESKLKVVDLKDISKTYREAHWAPDKDAAECKICEKEFNISRRRHHCRHCGNIFCSQCSDNTMPLPSSSKPVRVCDLCHTQLLQRYQSDD